MQNISIYMILKWKYSNGRSKKIGKDEENIYSMVISSKRCQVTIREELRNKEEEIGSFDEVIKV